MEDVKLRPVGTLACRCSAHARRPKRIFIGSHRGRLHAILAHAKRNFTPVTKWKLCASVFCINDSPPLDASSYFRFNRKRASERANRRWIFFFRFFFCSILVSCFFYTIFLNEWMDREIFENSRNRLISNVRQVRKIIRRMMKYFICWNIVESFDVEIFFTS